MESHPLNLAHQQHRRAEAHLINNNYDEAMQCHHNAAELLLDAMKSTNNSVALESITLQHSYHLNQKDLIKTKKEQYARVKKAMDHLKYLSRDSTQETTDNSKLQVAIYKAFDETDQLLMNLSNKNDYQLELASRGFVKPKSQEIVVEELQTLSHNLHSLVEQLVFQVEVLKDENSTLKERVQFLEKERRKYLNLVSTNNLSNTMDGSPVTPLPVAIVPTPSKATNVTERPSHQAHFDLSALKND